MLNVAFYIALRIAAVLVPLVPARVAYALACTVGGLAYRFLSGPRQGISSNLARVLNCPANGSVVQKAVLEAFQHDAKNWVDTLRIRHITREDIERDVDLSGWEYIEQGLNEGKGAILIAMHLGNIDLVGQIVATKGRGLTIPVERMTPESLFQFIVKQRTHYGINVVPLERAPREMVRALKRGDIVGIAGDRNLAGRGVQVEFFGARTILPRGAVTLARRGDVPVFLGVGVRLADDRFRAFITPRIPMTWTSDHERDVSENTARIARLMEQFIRRFPDQWLVFSPVWPDAQTEHAATIEQQSTATV